MSHDVRRRRRRDPRPGRRRAAAGGRPGRRRHRPREGGRARHPPDRPQLRRRARRALLPRRARSRRGCAAAASGCSREFCAGARHRRTTRSARCSSRSTTTERGRLAAIEERAPRQRRPRRTPLGRGRAARDRAARHGVAGLHSPATAIVDFAGVTRALAAARRGRAAASVRCGVEVTGIAQRRRRRAPARATRDGRPHEERVRQGRALRRAAQRPAGRAGRRRARPADRAVPRRVLPLAPRAAATWSTGSSTRCPTRATRSSAST